MTKVQRWQEGRVDPNKEHFELRYGSAEQEGWDEWIPIALVGPPDRGVVNIQFLVSQREPANASFVREVKGEVDFYLLEVGGDDPWTYAQYHSTTASNVYSKVHWSYFKAKLGAIDNRK
jgi:hypothetical protein